MSGQWITRVTDARPVPPGTPTSPAVVEDLKAATEVVVRETGQSRVHLFGESSARSAPAPRDGTAERVDRLVLQAFVCDRRRLADVEGPGEESRLFPHPQPPSARPRHDRSIFTRDKPGTSDPAVAEALADAELVFGREKKTRDLQLSRHDGEICRWSTDQAAIAGAAGARRA